VIRQVTNSIDFRLKLSPTSLSGGESNPSVAVLLPAGPDQLAAGGLQQAGAGPRPVIRQGQNLRLIMELDLYRYSLAEIPQLPPPRIWALIHEGAIGQHR